MLTIQKKQYSTRSMIITCVAFLLIVASLGLIIILTAPSLYIQPMSDSAIASTLVKDNRVIIPKIGVNITYGRGQNALNSGAEWRAPESGNPAEGGNFVLAAHRFTLQLTPQDTIRKSPFYNIDKLKVGDKILIDYSNTRYGYEINEIKTVPPTSVEIEARSASPKLTLYSCGLGGERDNRIVILAKPIGKVAAIY